MRVLIIIFLCCLSWAAQAQLFFEGGANAQLLSLYVRKSPALAAISELIFLSRGNPDLIFPNKRVTMKSLSPKISIGYRIPFDDFNVLMSAGASQDFDNLFRLGGIVAVKGRNYPVPKSFSARIRGYKTLKSGFSFGGEACYDNQKSEMLLNNSNLDRDVIGLLNQVSGDINLLGIGTSKYMQFNALCGWQIGTDRFELSAFSLIGKVGKSVGVQIDARVRYFFNKKG